MGFNSIEALKKHLMKDLKESLETGASQSIHVQMNQALEEVVYWYPHNELLYTRRYRDTGGLMSDEAFWKQATPVGGNTIRLEIENRAKANPYYDEIINSPTQYLTPLIVYGHGGAGGSYSYGDEFRYGYTKPRDFITETRDKLRSKGSHKYGLMNALEDRGYEVRSW